jgi:signal transduction histidine kinase/CheY-like chemotaxis protein
VQLGHTESPAPVSTTGKLWLGYGLLLVLMIGIGLFVAHRLTRIDRGLTIITAVRDPAGEAAFPMQVDLLAGSEALVQYVARGDPGDRDRSRARFDAFQAKLARHAGRSVGFDGRAHLRWAELRAAADSLAAVSDQLRTATALQNEASSLLDQSPAPTEGSPDDFELRTMIMEGRIALHQSRARQVRVLTTRRDALLARFTAVRAQLADMLDARIQAIAHGDIADAQTAARRAVQSSLTALLLLLGAGLVIGAATAFPTGASIVQAERRLLEQREELALAHRRKDEFIALMSHELRNPLAPISNALFVLQARSRGLPEDVRQAHALMRRQIEHVTRLVDDLLNISRIDEGKITLKREPVNLVAAVTEAAGLVRTQGPQRRHLALTVPRHPVWVDGDPLRVAQIAGNLIQNAIQYTKTGGHVDIRLVHENARAVLSVSDDGVGIAPELIERVFEPFVQAEPARATGGLGLGLTLVRRLVEMHGGEVSAASGGSGAGSTFTVTLPALEAVRLPARTLPAALPPPAVPAPRSSSAPAAAHSEAGAHSSRILVVDDSRDGAETMAELLRVWGHSVEVAFDGPSAVQLATEHEPDIVLLDIALPGLDGYQVAEKLRGRPNGARMRLVAITGFGTPEDRERARAAGFDEHVTKPVAPGKLKELVS